MSKKESIKNVIDAEKQNWHIVNILAKIKPAKMDGIVFVKNVVTTRAKKCKCGQAFFITSKGDDVDWQEVILIIAKNVKKQ